MNNNKILKYYVPEYLNYLEKELRKKIDSEDLLDYLKLRESKTQEMLDFFNNFINLHYSYYTTLVWRSLNDIKEYDDKKSKELFKEVRKLAIKRLYNTIYKKTDYEYVKQQVIETFKELGMIVEDFFVGNITCSVYATLFTYGTVNIQGLNQVIVENFKMYDYEKSFDLQNNDYKVTLHIAPDDTPERTMIKLLKQVSLIYNRHKKLSPIRFNIDMIDYLQEVVITI